MRVKWNRHLDLGVRQQRTCDSESPELPNHINNSEGNISVSANYLFRKKPDVQQDSSGILGIFRTKKLNRDDLSQCSISSSNSSVGHLVRRASLPTRLKRKIRTNDCGRPSTSHVSDITNAHNNASATFLMDSPLTLHTNKEVVQHHYAKSEDIWKHRDDGAYRAIMSDCDPGRHSSASFSRDSTWRKTLPVPRSETESVRSSVYQVGKNPTLTKSASLSACQPTDPPGRQTLSNFSQSIKSLEPTVTQARSGKVNLFSAAKSFFSGSKITNKKSSCDTPGPGKSKLKRSVSVSDGRGKSGASIPDAGPSGSFTRDRWHSVSGRVRSQSNVQELEKHRVKPQSKLSELFSSFKSSLKSLDSRSHREQHYFDERDDGWSTHQSQNITENNSVSSLLIYDETLELNLASRSLQELNEVVSSCLLLPEKNNFTPKEHSNHSYDDERYDNFEILKTPSSKCINGSMTKCELTTFECAEHLVHSKEFKTSTVQTFCSNQSHIYDVKFDEKVKLYSTGKEDALDRQPVKKDSELVHALDTAKINNNGNSPREKIPPCQQSVESSICDEKHTEKSNPHSFGLDVESSDYISDDIINCLCEYRNGIFDSGSSDASRKEAKKQVESVVESNANSFNNSDNTFSHLNDYDDHVLITKNPMLTEDAQESGEGNPECQVMSDSGSTISDAQNMNSLQLSKANVLEQLPVTELFQIVESRDMPVNGISTLDGTIVLTDDKPIFCDSSFILFNDSNLSNFNVDKVDSHSLQETTIIANGIFVPSNDCLVLTKNQDPAFVKQDREHYDAVASLNLPNDEIKTGRSNEARPFTEPDSIKDVADEDASKGIEISFRTTATFNYKPCDAIATDRDDAENTVRAIESVEKRLTSDLNEKGLGSHDSVSHGRHSEDDSGKEESSETCGRHSPTIVFPLVDGTVSNPRGRVRWSDTLQSFTASTEEGSKLTERSSLHCDSLMPPTSIRLSSEKKAFYDFDESVPCSTPFQTHANEDNRHETREVMISDNITTTKSAIKDISGAIAELQNAISTTFGLGCDFDADDDGLIIKKNCLPNDKSSDWSNGTSEALFCNERKIQPRSYETEELFCSQENVHNYHLESPHFTPETNHIKEDDLSSHNSLLLLSKTRNFSDAENNNVTMKENWCRDKFCSTDEWQQKTMIISDVPCVNLRKDLLITHSDIKLLNGGIPHTNNEGEGVVSLAALEAQHSIKKKHITVLVTEFVNNVDCDTALEGNPVLEVNGESVIRLSQSINVPNVLQSVESSTIVDCDTTQVVSPSTEFSTVVDCDTTPSLRSSFFRTTFQVADFKEANRYGKFESLENFNFAQTSIFDDAGGLHFIGSLDCIPKLNLIPTDTLVTSDSLSISKLWKSKSEEMLPVSNNRGCCSADDSRNKTFCRLRRSKALAKVCVKGVKEDEITSCRKNPPKATKLHSFVKVKPLATPLSREKNCFPLAPNHPCPNDFSARTSTASSDPEARGNGILPYIITPTIQIETKETNCAGNDSGIQPNGVDADIKSSDYLKDTRMSIKKKNIANGMGSINSAASKQTSLEAVGQVPRPLRGNTPVVKPTTGRGITEKTGLNKGHPRSRSSRIPRKQHEGGRPLIPPKPVRPPMWLSKAELTQEIQHLSSLCEARTKELTRLKMQTKHVTCGFDALAIAIQYMSEDLHVFENPGLLLNLKQTQEKVNKEKKDMECYEKKIAALNTLHAKEMSELLESLTTRHESELQELLLKHTTEMNFLREQHKSELVSFTEALQASCEEERLQQENLISDLRKELKQQREEVEMFHQQELNDLEERYHERQTALKDEIRKLQKQLSDAKHTSCTMEEAIQKDTDSKLHWLSEKKNDLQNEVDSLKAVLEIKNNELHALRKENLEMQKEVEELPLAKERIKMLQARAEDLQALMSDKVLIERQLSTEHKIMTESYEKEAKVNRRLSMENEELQWRLKQVSEQSLLSHTTEELSETDASDLHLQEESSIFDDELPSPIKCSSPISSSKPMFFTYMNDEELALSSQSPRMHYKQIKPCSSSHRPSSARSAKSASTPSPRKSKGSADTSPLCGGGTPRKMAKHLNRAAQRSSTKQKLGSSIDVKTQDGNIHEQLEISVMGLADSLVSSASSDNSVFEPCLLEEHGEEIRETLKLLQQQNNTEFIYDVSSPSYDSNGKWHVPIDVVKSESVAMDQFNSVESIDPKTFYHVAFPVLKESEAAPEEADKIELSELEDK